MRRALFAALNLALASLAPGGTPAAQKFEISSDPWPSYDGSEGALNRILDTFTPSAKAGNPVASRICRESLFALRRHADADREFPISDDDRYERAAAKASLDRLVRQAEADDVFYQKITAWFYDCGVLVERDAKKAGEWYARSANGGYARSQWLLGLAFNRQCATNGYADGQLGLGFMHDKGYGLPRNKGEAFKWYEMAARQGNAAALYNMGVSHRFGIEGILPADSAKALDYFTRAAERGDTSAFNALGIVHREGEGVPTNLTAAADWFRKSAERNDHEGRALLGRLYEHGLGGSEGRGDRTGLVSKGKEGRIRTIDQSKVAGARQADRREEGGRGFCPAISAACGRGARGRRRRSRG